MHRMIDRLRAFNMWRDDFLIEASTLLLIIGFIMGTVDIFVTGSVATQQWFKVSWAIVQALAIDGLFFAVWGKVARAEWTRASLKQTIPLAFVGIVLAVVAVLVNDILTYQQINGIVNSIDAMKQLGISVVAFTHMRAVLVVAVGVLVQLFCRSHGTVDSTETGHLDNGTVVNVNVLQNNGTPTKPVLDAVGTPGQLPEGHAQRDSGTVQIEDDKLTRTIAFLQDNPQATDEMLAGHLGMLRPASARFWRLKAQSLSNGTGVHNQRDSGTVESVHVDTSDTGTLDKVRDILTERPAISVRQLAKELDMPKTTAANWRLKALES